MFYLYNKLEYIIVFLIFWLSCHACFLAPSPFSSVYQSVLVGIHNIIIHVDHIYSERKSVNYKA